MAVWWVIVVIVVARDCGGRTVDGGGRNDLVDSPVKLTTSTRNDIHGGLMDKSDREVTGGGISALIPTTPQSLPDFNDVASLEQIARHAAVNPPEDDEDFDENPFENETDLSVIMKRMYESLTRRLNLLKSRITSVEQTAGDVFARLTVLDCADLLARGQKESLVYTFHMDHNGKRPVTVFCDMETDGGGWTVIQRRLHHPRSADFNRGWYDYKMGFGSAYNDYWIGLENIYILTNTRHYEMRIDLTDFAGDTAFATYNTFYVEGEEQGYRLHVAGYSGTAGDALGNEGKPDNFTADGMMFTTRDNDHDTSREINCARYWKIGGWWFNRCSWANLNGPYKESGDGIGINWHMWRNKQYLKSSSIMIRPAKTLETILEP